MVDRRRDRDDRYRGGGRDEGDDGGFIARRGFGTRGGFEDRGDEGRERDGRDLDEDLARSGYGLRREDFRRQETYGSGGREGDRRGYSEEDVRRNYDQDFAGQGYTADARGGYGGRPGIDRDFRDAHGDDHRRPAYRGAGAHDRDRTAPRGPDPYERERTAPRGPDPYGRPDHRGPGLYDPDRAGHRDPDPAYRGHGDEGGRGGRDLLGDERVGFGAMGAYPGPERTYAGPYGYGVGDRDGSRRGDQRGFFERAGDEVASWFGSEGAERRRREDAQRGDPGAQHHRGRGPRGYQRSDERIRDDVNDRLTEDAYVDASEIEVTVENREVTLSGTVTSRFSKRHAEDIAESVSGVTHVQNNLRVVMREYGGRAVQGSEVGMGSSLTANHNTREPGTMGGTHTTGAVPGGTTPMGAANAGGMGGSSPTGAELGGGTTSAGAGSSPGTAAARGERGPSE